MDPNRRQALALALASAGSAALTLRGAQAADRRAEPAGCGAGQPPRPEWPRGIEGQRRADLGDGRFLNPVLAGDRPDPSVLKDGADYYAAFSTFLFYPGMVIWHSRDLINWTPIGPALRKPISSVWAPDLAKHQGRYFIYIPVLALPGGPVPVPAGAPFKNYVIHASSMHGPWSDPIDLGLDGYIDPGHAVGEDGKRYLFLNGGHRVRLADDGLRTDGPVEKVHDGWPIPDDWIIEAPAHEGPKVLRHNGWFYLFSGQGGTSGPPTSHMVVVARSRSIHGPWENCPHNPIVRTASRTEPWWSRGHATPVQGPRGDWWLVYHGYENGFRTLGRQMLVEPFSWSSDGWPEARGGDLGRPLAKPVRTASGGHGIALSDDFATDTLGTKLAFYAPRDDYMSRIQRGAAGLTVRGQGDGPANSSPLAFIAGDRSYEVTVRMELEGDVQGGLLLFYDNRLFCGIGAEENVLHAYKVGQEEGYPPPGPAVGRRLALRVVNDEDVASFFISRDGTAWRKCISFEVSGYHQNIGGGFMSLKPAIFAAGPGRVTFRSLSYRALLSAHPRR